MNFREHYFTEAILPDSRVAVTIEEAIVDIINKGTSKYTRFNDVLKQIIDHLELKGNAEYMGKTVTNPLNDFYLNAHKELFPDKKSKPNQTSKTDFVVNEDRISLKLHKGWIFAHMLEDSQICLMYVMNKSTSLKEELKNQINTFFKDLKEFTPVKPKDSGIVITKGKDKDKPVNSYVLKNELVSNFIRAFETAGEELKSNFIQTALTGDFKFDHNSKAVADHIMVIRFKDNSTNAAKALTNIELVRLNESGIYDLYNDMDYIKKVADKSKIAFRVLESGKLNMQVSSTITPVEDMLIEGLLDKAIELVKQGYEKVKDKLIKIWQYILNLIDKGIEYVMNLLGLKVVVDMENEIVFP